MASSATSDLKPILSEDGSGRQSGESCSEYNFCIRGKCLSGPPRPVSRWSAFQYFAQIVSSYTVRVSICIDLRVFNRRFYLIIGVQNIMCFLTRCTLQRHLNLCTIAVLV